MTLTIRAYNVLFGDCILLSWDEDDGKHHAWIDFGNFHNDRNDVFTIVYEDVLQRTGGKLDLAMVTHRHLDHLEGFYALRKRFRDDFEIDRLWHAHMRKDADDLFKLADQTMVELMPSSLRAGPGDLGRIYRNNHYLATKERMDEIIADFPAGSVHAVHRDVDLEDEGALPSGMRRMKVEILAPEEDSRVYLTPLEEHLGARTALNSHFNQWAEPAPAAPAEEEGGTAPPPERGEDAAGPPQFFRLADFARLRRQLRSGGLDILAAVDRTRNNTSVVMRWTYGGVTLLLTGDAELGSWAIMRRNGADLSAVVLKVGHHGSINASPSWAFTEVFPRTRPSNAVILSTDPTRFTGENEVPKQEVVEGWTSRLRWPSRFKRTDDVDAGESVEVVFSR